MKNSSLALIIFGLILLLCINTHSLAEIYKWVDENGNVHFGQIPPDEDAQQIGSKSDRQGQSSTSSTSDSATRINQQAEELEKDQQKAKEQQKKVAEEEKRQAIIKENCKRAQTNYNTISQGGRMYEVDPSGERHYWSDSERAAKLSNAKEAVDKWCSGN